MNGGGSIEGTIGFHLVRLCALEKRARKPVIIERFELLWWRH